MSIYISGEKNITFLHIPKTAGTSITCWLAENAGNSLISEFEGRPAFSKILKNNKRNFSFTVVRNPWDRVVSVYHFLKNIILEDYKDSEWAAVNQYTKETFPVFDTWVKSLEDLKYSPDMLFTIYTQQVNWIDAPVDKILRFETLSEEFNCIQSEYSCTVQLPSLFVSGHTAYTDYYTDETKKIVANIYMQDIDELKYTFK
jgi:chondroitin 4-sulfotransferase 11